MLSQDLQISLTVALNEAARRGHEFASTEHLLYALLHDDETAEVLRGAGANLEALKRDLDQYLTDHVEALPEERRRQPQASMGFQRVLQRAIAHVESSGKAEVRGLNVLVAIFAEDESWAVHFLERQGVSRLDIVSYISHGLGRLTAGTAPQAPALTEADDDEDAPMRPGASALESFCTNLNAQAREGRIDPLIGRRAEVERMLHVLSRRRKNNPVLVGDSGVGKTAIVEGLAGLIEAGEVPDAMKGVTVYSLDLGAMLAGTRYRGDFENRFKAVLKELEALADAPPERAKGAEGADGADGAKAAAGAEGEARSEGSEGTPPERGKVPILFIDEIHTIVGAGAVSGGSMDASNMLKPALASGRLRFAGSTTFEEYRKHFEKDRALARRFQKVEVLEPSQDDAIRILGGLKPHYESFHKVTYTRPALRAAVELGARYLQGRRLPDSAIDLIDEAGAAARLAGRDGARIGARDIETIVATMAQIPPKRVSRDDRERLQGLETDLKRVVYGQDHAIEQLVGAIRMARAGLREPHKPIGSFLLTGPTGVGKTEVARQLAKTMGLELLRYDMSEYMERHTVSRLIGAPPGYVGFDQGGLLTEAVTKTPHAVLLLDEIEKAHPDVFNILLQVMDHGTLTDNNGKKTDFRHVVLLMTSNVGARELERRSLGFGEQTPAGKDDKEYERVFSPEFRNRLDARIKFAPLSAKVMDRIVDKFLHELWVQLADRKVTLEVDADVRAHLAKEGFDPKFGARPLARVVQDLLKRPLSEAILFGDLQGGGHATATMKDGEVAFVYGPRGGAAATDGESDDEDGGDE